MDLKKVTIVASRVEEVSKEYIEAFDIVTARAVANLKILSELCIPMVKVNGLFIAMKANIEEEIENSTEILKKLDSKIEKIETFYLPIENSIRNIIMIQKQKTTNNLYPRRIEKMK